MASVYQTWEWRQGGAPPPPQEHPLHTDLGGGSRRRGKRDPSSSQGRTRMEKGVSGRREAAALEDLEGICSLCVENQRRNILERKNSF